MLLAVAKKKPRLQALIDNVSQTSEEEIDALSEALWIREALKTLKASGGKGQKERLNNLLSAVEEAEKQASEIPKPTYEVRMWQGDSEMIGSNGQSKSWKIEVEDRDTFLIVDDDYVRFGDSMLKVDEFDRYPLMLRSKFVGYMTLENYKGFHRELLNQKHKNL